MVINKSFGEKAFDAGNYLFLMLLMMITIYPILHVAFASVSDASQLMAHNGILLGPKGFSLEAYKAVIENPMISVGYGNTILYVVVGTAINLFMTSMGAYVLSRKGFMWKNYIMFIVILTMFFSGGLIPQYLLIKAMGGINHRWSIIIPGAISTMNLIIMKTSFEAIPESLEESARIDGANDFIILFRIILPLSMPVIAVMILYYGVAHWNAWFNAMLYFREKTLFPLQLVLREILINSSTQDMMENTSELSKFEIGQTIKYATIMVATIPILIVYPMLQKYFVKGVMIGAVKG